MRVQFEFTEDDMIDASKRFSGRLKIVHSLRLKSLLATSFWVWVLVFCIFFKTPIKGVILGLIAAALCALFLPGANKRALEKGMRKIARGLFGNASSFLCEVELRPDGVWVRSMNRQTIYEWPTVEEVKDTSDSVDIFTRDGSGVVVRNRAFSSPEERTRFVELARAGSSSNHSSSSAAQSSA
jgi:hypothetical protein